MHDTPLNGLIREYYAEILRYCAAKLNRDTSGAEDCTQEVFCLLVKKADSLNIAKDIRPWLYAAADRIILQYKRKHPETVPLESIPEDRLTTDFPYNDTLSSVLDEEEIRLLKAYFGGADKAKLAARYGLSTAALYMRILRLKEKLRKNLDNSD